MDLAMDQFDVSMSWYGEFPSVGPLRLCAWILSFVIILSLITAYHKHGMIRNSCQLCVSHVTVMLSFVL